MFVIEVDGDVKEYFGGIVYFFEYKLFEREDVSDLMLVFMSLGVDSNVFISFIKINYFFLVMDYFLENVDLFDELVILVYFIEDFILRE